MERLVPLEKAAEAVCEANSKPPLIFQLPPAKGPAGSGKRPEHAGLHVSRHRKHHAVLYRPLG